MHREGVPSLVANTLDHACYYSKPGIPDVPAANADAKWTCNTPQCPFGCKFSTSQWSDGTPEFNCKMRKLAWEYGQTVRPDYAQFADLYYALGLNDDCTEEVPIPSFTPADQAPPPKVFQADGNHSFYVDFVKGADANAGTLGSPFKTIQAAVDAAARSGTGAVVNLRGGTHYVASTVQISADNKKLTIQNYNGETVVVSGAVKLQPKW
jgi:hypothetical protein